MGESSFGARDENENQAVVDLAPGTSRKQESGRGYPLPEHEVQLGIRTGRPRGAPLGNANRLKHGDYSAQRIQRRKEVNVLLRNARNLIRRVEMMTWSRRALRRKMERAASVTTVIPGERRAQSAWGEGREPNFWDFARRNKLGPLPSTRADARASPGMTSEGKRGSPGARASPGTTGKTRDHRAGTPRGHSRNPWVSPVAGVTSPGRLLITQHG